MTDILNDLNEAKPEWFNELHSKFAKVPVHPYEGLPLALIEKRSIVEMLDAMINEIPVIGKRVKDMTDNLRPDGYTYREDMTQEELDNFEAIYNVQLSRNGQRYLTARYCIWRIRQKDEGLADQYSERLSEEYNKVWDMLRTKPQDSANTAEN